MSAHWNHKYGSSGWTTACFYLAVSVTVPFVTCSRENPLNLLGVKWGSEEPGSNHYISLTLPLSLHLVLSLQLFFNFQDAGLILVGNQPCFFFFLFFFFLLHHCLKAIKRLMYWLYLLWERTIIMFFVAIVFLFRFFCLFLFVLFQIARRSL